jgi:hypothetical protein
VVKLSERYKLDRYSDVIDDEAHCAICGEALKVGDEAIDVGMGELHGRNLIAPAHLGCAVNNGEVDLTA